MNSYLLFWLLLVLLLAISGGTGIFYAYRAFTIDKSIPHKSSLVSAIGSFPAWFCFLIYIVLSNETIKQFAINFFAGNGWIFAGMFAFIICLIQYKLLDLLSVKK